MMIIIYGIRGFTQEGILRSDERVQGKSSDSYVYSVLREEYENEYNNNPRYFVLLKYFSIGCYILYRKVINLIAHYQHITYI